MQPDKTGIVGIRSQYQSQTGLVIAQGVNEETSVNHEYGLLNNMQYMCQPVIANSLCENLVISDK